MSEVLAKQEELVSQYLAQIEHPDLPFMTDGKRDFSAQDIADEIRRGTEFGREQLLVLLVQRKLDQLGSATPDDFVRLIEEAKTNPHFIKENL